jgi:hypothetical protein
MEVSLPVSSSSQKEEARFLPHAVDSATEVERSGAITARARAAGQSGIQRALAPRRTREQRARQPVINDPSFGEDPERLGLWSRPSSEALREWPARHGQALPLLPGTLLSTPIAS